MRVGLFPVMAGRQAAGPETYETSLLKALVHRSPEQQWDVFCLSAEAKRAMSAAGEGARYHVLRPAVRWLSVPISLPLAVRRARVDLLHAMLIAPPVAGAPFVLTVHDLTMLRNPEFYPALIRFRLQQTIRPAIQKAKMLICISEFVRREVQMEFDVPAEKLAVVHHGVDARFRPVPEARAIVARELGIQRPYLLFLGQMKRRKNIHRILEAFAQVRADGYDLDLVLAGRRGTTSEGMDELIDRLKLRPYVLEPGHVPDALLPACYSAAELFVFPSLNEGFGLPVLEAMACGTPVLTSRTTALPEVAGEAALLVDPASVDAIAGGMVRLIGDTALRASLRAAGLRQSAQFTWDRCAERTEAVYRQALEGRGA